MKVEITKRARKDLLSIEPKTCTRILDAIEGLQQEPPAGDTKKLRGMVSECHRRRVGDFGVIFRVDVGLETVYVLHVAHRREVYR